MSRRVERCYWSARGREGFDGWKEAESGRSSASSWMEKPARAVKMELESLAGWDRSLRDRRRGKMTGGRGEAGLKCRVGEGQRRTTRVRGGRRVGRL